MRCAKPGKKYVNVFGQVLTELRECLKFYSKKHIKCKMLWWYTVPIPGSELLVSKCIL